MSETTDKKSVALPQWRRDFPIEVGDDNYFSRREFTKFMVLTSGAFVAGQVWIGVQSARHAADKPAPRAIAAIGSLPVGGTLQFAYPGANDPCLLVRLDETRYVAFSQKCTHLSCAVIPHVDEGRFHCPCHNGSFDLVSGKPLAGPPRRPLPKISLDIRDGQIFAIGVEVST